jgi:beta-phosphoglucomutase-like phosphatase (HAD superfamily)
MCHWRAYKKAGLDMEWPEFEKCINLNTLEVTEEMRDCKNKLMKDECVRFIPGAEEFLKRIGNHVIVTNSTRSVVEFYKLQLPVLATLNIVCREEYADPKPSPDGYEYGIQKYYRNEKYIVGFENTIIGYHSMKHCTKNVYMVSQLDSPCYKELKKEKVRFIRDYLKFIVSTSP